MTRAQIIKKRKDIQARLKQVRRQEKAILAEWHELMEDCPHPHMRKYSAMGEIGNTCDDCGYQD